MSDTPEARLGKRVLDRGYVELVESWGSDERVIEAARMSTQKGFEGWGPNWRCSRALCDWTGGKFDEQDQPRSRHGRCPKCGTLELVAVEGDEKLLRYLWKNGHATPFEMAGAIFEVQAPIFVFREWHRHRTQGYAEMSSRYAPLPDYCYLPDPNDAVARSEAASRNRQAGTVAGASVLTLDAALDLLKEEADLLVVVEDLYQRKLKAGFPKELARTHLTVSRYSRMRATANLRNWLAFLTLRDDARAQKEIREFARVVCILLTELFPRTLALFQEGRS